MSIDFHHYAANVLYNKTHLKLIQETCKPLQNIGISSFAYVRIFDDGYQICLTNNLDYSDFCLKNDYVFRTKFFQLQYQYFSKYKNYKTIWPHHVDDDLINGLKALNICQGFNLTRYDRGWLETCFFGSTNDNDELRVLYNKHSEILEIFRDYFVNRLTCIINDAHNHRSYSPQANLILPSIEQAFYSKSLLEDNIHQFLNSIDVPSYSVKRNYKDVVLSKREIECLSYLTLGQSTKEIAYQLHVKPRTIEKHLENIRYKTDYHSKSDLIHWFKDNIQWQ